MAAPPGAGVEDPWTNQDPWGGTATTRPAKAKAPLLSAPTMPASRPPPTTSQPYDPSAPRNIVPDESPQPGGPPDPWVHADPWSGGAPTRGTTAQMGAKAPPVHKGMGKGKLDEGFAPPSKGKGDPKGKGKESEGFFDKGKGKPGEPKGKGKEYDETAYYLDKGKGKFGGDFKGKGKDKGDQEKGKGKFEGKFDFKGGKDKGKGKGDGKGKAKSSHMMQSTQQGNWFAEVAPEVPSEPTPGGRGSRVDLTPPHAQAKAQAPPPPGGGRGRGLVIPPHAQQSNDMSPPPEIPEIPDPGEGRILGMIPEVSENEEEEEEEEEEQSQRQQQQPPFPADAPPTDEAQAQAWAADGDEAAWNSWWDASAGWAAWQQQQTWGGAEAQWQAGPGQETWSEWGQTQAEQAWRPEQQDGWQRGGDAAASKAPSQAYQASTPAGGYYARAEQHGYYRRPEERDPEFNLEAWQGALENELHCLVGLEVIFQVRCHETGKGAWVPPTEENERAMVLYHSQNLVFLHLHERQGSVCGWAPINCLRLVEPYEFCASLLSPPGCVNLGIVFLRRDHPFRALEIVSIAPHESAVTHWNKGVAPVLGRNRLMVGDYIIGLDGVDDIDEIDRKISDWMPTGPPLMLRVLRAGGLAMSLRARSNELSQILQLAQ